MRDVQLDGHPLLVEGRSTEFGLILRRQGVTMGCHSSACSSQPCYSPFLCVDLWRKYECRYMKLLFSSRDGWEAFVPYLTRQLASNSEIHCGFWPERVILRTNPSLHLISNHGLDLPFSASLVWSLITPPFFPWLKITRRPVRK